MKIYEKQTDTKITKAIILTKAFDTSLGITNWKKVVQDNSIPLNNIYPVEEKELKLNVDVSDRVAKGITQYKQILPFATNTKSVTLGVCVKFIIKASLLVHLTEKENLESDDEFDKQFLILQSSLEELVAPINHDLLKNILWKFKNKYSK